MIRDAEDVTHIDELGYIDQDHLIKRRKTVIYDIIAGKERSEISTEYGFSLLTSWLVDSAPEPDARYPGFFASMPINILSSTSRQLAVLPL